MTREGWVVCAPGDPTDTQLEAIIGLAYSQAFCMHRFNEHTGEVDVIINRAHGEARFVVDRHGVATRVSRWTIRHTRLGYALLHDGELVAGAIDPLELLLFVPTLTQEGPS